MVTYPGQQGLPLGYMVDEFEGPGGAVDAAVHVTVEVQQSHLLLIAAVWSFHLWAAGEHPTRGRKNYANKEAIF